MAELRLVLEYSCPDSDYERLKRAIESSVQAGQEEILRALVSNDGRNLNDFGVDVLFEAVEDISDLSVLKFLLRRLGGEAIGQVRNELNLSVVHLAALIQDRELAAETMQTLRNALGDGCFSVVSGLNSTAAHFAAKNSNGHEVLIWILDNLGQQALTVKDSLGDTAVHLAAEFQTDECMRLLKAKLPQRVWQARGALRRTPVHRAALNCTGEQSGDTLKWMLENLELEVFKKPDAENNTAVHLAARHQGFECMQMLQDRLGASCFLTPGYQLQTAVHMAARNENGYAALEWFVTNIGSIDHLLIKDANGDTAVHVAAEYQDDECMQLFSTRLPPEHNVWQMEGGLKRTPVHRAALNEKSVLTLHWILDYLAKRPAIFQLRDAQGDTAIHLAAQVQSDECMELLSQHLTLENPVWNTAGAKGRKPVHCLAANAIQREFLKVLVDKLGSSALTEVDEELLTAIHLAASYQSLALFQSLVSCAGKDSITLRDKHGWTPLFMATGNERHEKDESVFFWMMNQLKGSQEQELASKDSDGRTCLHLCARNRAFGAQMFVQSAPQHQFDDPSDAVAASVDKNDRNPLFLACLLKNFNFFKAEFIDVKRHMCIDSVGNTLLHALFLTSESFPNRDFDADEFVSAVKKLIDGGVDPKVENNVKKNCLMSAEFSQRTLYDVLVRLSHLPELKEAFSRLQRNSDGLHVVHVFSGRYDIRFLEAPLKQLFTLSSDKLLNIRVSSGSLSGATCLHFACEAGHEENLRFLIGKGLCDARLGCETASGQTCVDFACNKGKLDVLRSAAADAGVDLREILLLVDPVKKALQLPDKTSARNLLSLFTDPVLRSDIERDRGLPTAGDEAEGQASAAESADVKLLIRALELDSTEMLRSLVVLDYVTGDTDDRLIKALRKRYQSKNPSQQKYFPNMETLDLIATTRTELSLLDCVIFFDKANLLSDLMVLPQFDIIPQTLRLLINMTPQVEMRRGRHEQLSEMMKQALNVLTNVLEQLYVRADQNERELLFRYLTADFKKDEVSGPKFQAPLKKFVDKKGKVVAPFSGPAECFSVMQLVDTVDCDELFATNCLSSMIDEQWKKPPPLSWRTSSSSQPCCPSFNSSCSPGSRPDGVPSFLLSVRFRVWIHMVFFLFFLCFFSWYVTDFGQSLKSQAAAVHIVDAVMWMFALSFATQEINDMVNRGELKDTYAWGRHLKVPRYFTDLFNYFDLAAILLLLAGLILKIVSTGGDTTSLHNAQVVLSASFLLWGFRSVSLLSYFKVTGPKISMLKSLLLSDLAPFLIIMLVLVYSFGIFYVNLLFPVTLSTASILRDSESIAKQVFSLPVSLAFGFFEGAESVVCNGSRQTLEACSDHAGYRAYSGLLMFLYLLIVNIVMWNLLIALFNLTVTSMDTKAEVIWRKNLYEMLVEFSEVSPFPPPFSFPHYICKLGRYACRRLENRRSVQPEEKQSPPWWQERSSFHDYPNDYRQFLVYQAEQLRQCRPRLRQGVERHRDAFEALRAHTEKTVDGTRDELARMVKRETLDIREQLHRLRRNQKKQQKQLSQVLDLLKHSQAAAK